MHRFGKTSWFISCLAFLLLGCCIYAVFQPRTVLFAAMAPILTERRPIAGLISSYGADLCWAAAFTLGMQWCLNLRGANRYWLLLCGLLGVLYEAGQYFRWFSGTFDPWDLAIYFLGAWIALLLTRQGGKT